MVSEMCIRDSLILSPCGPGPPPSSGRVVRFDGSIEQKEVLMGGKARFHEWTLVDRTESRGHDR